MKTVRVIPRLDIKGPNLVKGIHLEGLRVLGKPEDFARQYYKDGADELVYMDVVASLYERNSLHDFISRTAKEIFIPLTVGGGIRTIQDIKEILRAGADKVSLNTAAIKNPSVVSEAANMFGSSTITVSIEAAKQSDGQYLAFTDNGREYTGIEVGTWSKEVERRGAGEIIVTSIDREGTGRGYDTALTELVAKQVSIPVVACGGAKSDQDVLAVIEQGGADAVAVASLFHYDFIKRRQSVADTSEGNVEFLKQNKAFSVMKPTTIRKVKQYLHRHDIQCRLTN